MDGITASAVPTDFNSFIIFIRMAERILLTVFFVITASVIMVAYRKKIQNVDMNLSSEAGSLKTTASLVMPVFILLTIILFSHVVLVNPISMKSNEVAREIDSSDQSQNEINNEPKNTAFLGYEAGGSGQQKLAKDLLAVVTASSNLRRLSVELSSEQRNVIRTEVDNLGRAANGLQNMLFELLNEKFPESRDCQPSPMDGFAPSNDEKCQEFNTFLFE